MQGLVNDGEDIQGVHFMHHSHSGFCSAAGVG
jgi:hypothetical protein